MSIELMKARTREWFEQGLTYTDASIRLRQEFPTITHIQVVLSIQPVYLIGPREMAILLHNAGATPAEAVHAMHQEDVFPDLTAVRMGEILLEVWFPPRLTEEQVGLALAAGGYTAEQIALALTILFPKQPTYRKEGPVGHNGPYAFDDTEEAKQLNKPITRIHIRSGNIVDGLQIFYDGIPTPAHGGERGAPHNVVIESGDALVEVWGYYGRWFGATYILQLNFITKHGHKHGPFGNMEYASSKHHFTFKANTNEMIIAFFGSAVRGLEADNTYTHYMSSIGVTIKKG